MIQIADDFPEKEFKLQIVEWEGRIHCVYLNEFRIAGGKPWGGGKTIREWTVTGDDILRSLRGLVNAPPTPSERI